MVVSSSFEHETKTGLANILAKSSGQIVPMNFSLFIP